MQTQKGRSFVGETTGGGAHPARMARISDHFGCLCRLRGPSTRSRNRLGRTGVKPDVPVPADAALEKAQDLAIKKLLDKPKTTIRTGGSK